MRFKAQNRKKVRDALHERLNRRVRYRYLRLLAVFEAQKEHSQSSRRLMKLGHRVCNVFVILYGLFLMVVLCFVLCFFPYSIYDRFRTIAAFSDSEAFAEATRLLKALAAIQWSAYVFIGLGTTFRPSASHIRSDFLDRRATLVRKHRSDMRLLFMFLALAGAGMILPFRYSENRFRCLGCLAELGFSCAFSWTFFWICMWTTSILVPRPTFIVVAVLNFASTVAFIWLAQQSDVSLAWTGPIGFAYADALQTSLSGQILPRQWTTMIIVVSLGIIVRREVKGRVGLRRLLNAFVPESTRSLTTASVLLATSVVSTGPALNDFRPWFDEQIGGRTIRRERLVFPLWLHGRETFVATILGVIVCFQIVQGVLFRTIGTVNYFVTLTTVGIILLLLVLEGIAIYEQEFHRWLSIAQRPTTPGQLWRRSQWLGLIRTPLLGMFVSPIILVQFVLLPNRARATLFVTLSTLLTLVALRSIVLMVVVTWTQFSIFVRKYEVWQRGALKLTYRAGCLVASCIAVALSKLAIFGPSWYDAFAGQLLLQMLGMLCLTVTICMRNYLVHLDSSAVATP